MRKHFPVGAAPGTQFHGGAHRRNFQPGNEDISPGADPPPAWEGCARTPPGRRLLRRPSSQPSPDRAQPNPGRSSPPLPLRTRVRSDRPASHRLPPAATNPASRGGPTCIVMSIVTLRDSIRLEPGKGLTYDIIRFEDGLNEARCRAGDPTPDPEETKRLIYLFRATLETYRGDFLAEFRSNDFTMNERRSSARNESRARAGSCISSPPQGDGTSGSSSPGAQSIETDARRSSPGICWKPTSRAGTRTPRWLRMERRRRSCARSTAACHRCGSNRSGPTRSRAEQVSGARNRSGLRRMPDRPPASLGPGRPEAEWPCESPTRVEARNE
jgi:hypothetical protein